MVEEETTKSTMEWLKDTFPSSSPLPFKLRVIPDHTPSSIALLLRGQEKWVLRKLSTSVSKEMVQEEYTALCRLHDKGMAVPRPIAKKDDVFVMEFIPGRVIHALDSPLLAIAERKQLLESAVNYLHQLHAVNWKEQGWEEDVNEFERILSSWDSEGASAALTELFHLLKEDIPPMEAALVHGNVCLDHIVFASDSFAISAVVDWKKCCVGDKWLDMARLCTSWYEGGWPEGVDEDSWLDMVGEAPLWKYRVAFALFERSVLHKEDRYALCALDLLQEDSSSEEEEEDQLESLRDAIHTFMYKYVIPRGEEIFEKDHSHKVILALRDIAKQQGLFNVCFPVNVPGLMSQWGVLPFREIAIVAEELGHSLIGLAVVNAQVPDAGNLFVLGSYGTVEQKEQYLYPVLRGDMHSLLCDSEVSMQIEGNSIVLHSDEPVRCIGVQDAHCGWVLVMGKRTKEELPDHQRCSLIILPLSIKGLTLKKWDNFTSDMSVDHIRLPLSHIVGEEGEGLLLGQARHFVSQFIMSMRCIGLCERALRWMVSESKNSECIASCRVKIEQARLLALRAASEMDTHRVKWMEGNPKDRLIITQHMAMVAFAVPSLTKEVVDYALECVEDRFAVSILNKALGLMRLVREHYRKQQHSATISRLERHGIVPSRWLTPLFPFHPRVTTHFSKAAKANMARISGLYRQAGLGDAKGPFPTDPFERQKYIEWEKHRGMSREDARNALSRVFEKPWLDDQQQEKEEEKAPIGETRTLRLVMDALTWLMVIVSVMVAWHVGFFEGTASK